MENGIPKIGRRAEEWQVRANELRMLDELAYVIEGVAQTYTGEVKTELSRLIGWMESDLTVATSFAPELERLEIRDRFIFRFRKTGVRDRSSGSERNRRYYLPMLLFGPCFQE